MLRGCRPSNSFNSLTPSLNKAFNSRALPASGLLESCLVDGSSLSCLTPSGRMMCRRGPAEGHLVTFLTPSRQSECEHLQDANWPSSMPSLSRLRARVLRLTHDVCKMWREPHHNGMHQAGRRPTSAATAVGPTVPTTGDVMPSKGPGARCQHLSPTSRRSRQRHPY